MLKNQPANIKISIFLKAEGNEGIEQKDGKISKITLLQEQDNLKVVPEGTPNSTTFSPGYRISMDTNFPFNTEVNSYQKDGKTIQNIEMKTSIQDISRLGIKSTEIYQGKEQGKKNQNKNKNKHHSNLILKYLKME